jgi:hypothetical protein
MAVIAGSIYGMFVWYPEQRKRKIEELKASGRKGEATITRLDERTLRHSSTRRALFRMVPISLEIRVSGMEPYQVDKVFTIPSSAVEELQVGKIIPVWVDPQEPRNLDKIVIDLG